MLKELFESLSRAGDHFTLTLSFSRSGDITTRVDVVTPDELVDRTEGAA